MPGWGSAPAGPERPGQVVARRARTCTCRGRPSGPARGREAGARAPRGAVLRVRGLSLPRLHSPDETTAVAACAQGRSQRCTEPALRQREEEEECWPVDAATLSRGGRTALGAAEGERDCACAGSGARSRERPGPVEGRRDWGRGGGGTGVGLAWGGRSRRTPAPPGARRGSSQVPGSVPQVPPRAVALGTSTRGWEPSFPGLDGRPRVNFVLDGLGGGK